MFTYLHDRNPYSVGGYSPCNGSSNRVDHIMLLPLLPNVVAFGVTIALLTTSDVVVTLPATAAAVKTAPI